MSATKTVLYWIAGSAPTVNEAADIATLNAGVIPKYNVKVRTYKTAAAHGYGSGAVASPATDPVTGNLETADFCAAHDNANIPVAYNGVTALAVPSPGDVAGDRLVIGPAALSFVHTSVSQMSAFLVSDQGDVSDVTADAGMVWTSATGATATIGAGTGKLTGVGAGTTVVTATLTKSGKVMVATETVTCS